MEKKERKTLYLPLWIIDLLDSEGAKLDGPGAIAAAAIYDFSIKKKKEKVNVLKNYREYEAIVAYESDAAQILAEPGYNDEEHDSSKAV